MAWKSIWYRAPAVFYACGLFWASDLSRVPLLSLDFNLQDKLLHAVAYAIFSALIYRALARPTALVRRLHLWSAVLGIGYGVSDELHQLFVPGRETELGDLAADALGVILVQLVIWLWNRRQSG